MFQGQKWNPEPSEYEQVLKTRPDPCEMQKERNYEKNTVPLHSESSESASRVRWIKYDLLS
jgi:hypothetical protein